jgi:predicted xylose isomerase-like sugar epimerase
MTPDKVTKAEVRSSIRDIRLALRQAEAALDRNDWNGVVECLGYWASPSAGTIAEQVNDYYEVGRN